MKINPTNSINSAEQLTQLMTHIDTPKTGVANNPTFSQSPAQINRTVEISRDPPATVIKFTNAITKDVELQIPSEVSLRMYKANQEFIAQQHAKQNLINIKV